MTPKKPKKPKAPKAEQPVWCSLQGRYATLTECATGCAAPEQRPVCLMEREHAR